jgi:putative transposase
MALIEARDGEVPVDAACTAVNVSRASLYRSRHPATPAVGRVHAPNARRIPADERKVILDTLHLPEFADQPPHEVYATLLGRGVHLASIRTMYRVLTEAGETKERRNQRAPHTHAMPTVTATAPNQVWTWDITKLATTSKGVFLMAYVIIDLFSRFVVGWMVATKECKHLAAQLFAETIASECMPRRRSLGRAPINHQREYGKVGRFEVRGLLPTPPRDSLGDVETGDSGTASGTSIVSSVP